MALAAVAVIGLGACGSDDDGGAISAEGGAEVAEATHNEADVTFAQSMVPHHQQAIEMADLALERAESPDVKDLAQRIKDAQDPEIKVLEGWLAEWDEEVDSGMDGMDHGGGSGEMSEGMMSEDDMAELESLDGSAFDTAFLEMMKEHHEGAVTMARTEVEEGEYEPAKVLAQDVIDTQSAEIEEIDELLENM